MLTSYLQKLRLFSRDVWLLMIASATMGIVNFGILGVLRNLYLLRLGYGPEFIGLLFATSTLAWTICSIPAGILGRRWGTRRTIVLGMIVATVGAALFPCVEFFPAAWQPAWLVAVGALWAGGFTFYLVNTFPFLTAVTGEPERPYAFSMFLALIPLGGFVGALVAGQLPGLIATILSVPLDSPVSYRYPLWLGAALYIPGLLAMLAAREIAPVSTSTDRHETSPAPLAILAVLSLVTLLVKSGWAAPQSFFNVYLDVDLVVPTPRIGTLMAVAQLAGAAAGLAAPLLMARYGKRRTYVWACFGLAVGLLSLGLVPHWIAAGAGYVVFWGMGMIADASFQTFSQETVAPGWRSTTSGVILMAEGLSWTLVGVGGGRAIVNLDYRSVFLIVAALSVAGALLFWAYFRGRRGEPAQT